MESSKSNWSNHICLSIVKRFTGLIHSNGITSSPTKDDNTWLFYGPCSSVSSVLLASHKMLYMEN